MSSHQLTQREQLQRAYDPAFIQTVEEDPYDWRAYIPEEIRWYWHELGFAERKKWLSHAHRDMHEKMMAVHGL